MKNHNHNPLQSKTKKSKHNQHRGFTLIELLITLLVTSIGLLGLASLQIYSLKTSQSAAYQAQANILAYDMLDRMRANRTLAEAKSYDIGETGATPTSTSTMRDNDIKQWRAMLAASLPDGNGWIACAAAPAPCRIDVRWTDPNPVDPANPKRTITLVSRL